MLDSRTFLALSLGATILTATACSSTNAHAGGAAALPSLASRRPAAAGCPSAWNPNLPLPPNASGQIGAGLPLRVVNKSGFGNANIYLYATGMAGNGFLYLAHDGSVQYFNGSSSSAQAFELTCFPGSIPGRHGASFVIPGFGSGGRLWIAIAPSNPTPASNPLVIQGAGYGQFVGPAPWTPQWHDVLFDMVEFALAPAGSPNLDTSQVDFIGLPLRVSVGANAIGIPPANAAKLLTAFTNDANFGGLATFATINGKDTLVRVLAPSHAQDAGVAPNLWHYFDTYLTQTVGPLYARTINPANPSYHSIWVNITPTMTGAGISPSSFYVGYANGAFVFTPCAGTCSKGGPSGSGSTVSIPLTTLTSANIFANNQGGYSGGDPAYYLLKMLYTDLNRGVATVPGQHPVAPTQAAYYRKGPFSAYSAIAHRFSLGHAAYGFAWDDCCSSWGQSNDIAVPPGTSEITITIGPVLTR